MTSRAMPGPLGDADQDCQLLRSCIRQGPHFGPDCLGKAGRDLRVVATSTASGFCGFRRRVLFRILRDRERPWLRLFDLCEVVAVDRSTSHNELDSTLEH
jgi:hypothetical protein